MEERVVELRMRRERDVHEGTLGNDEEHAGDSEEDARERAEG